MNVYYKKQRWKKWLVKDLLPEIRYLIKLKLAYKKLEKIFMRSKKYPKGSQFYWYLGQVHAASIASGIYRLIDKRKDSVSLFRLLNEVKEYPELVSRRSYTRLKKGLYIEKFDYRNMKLSRNKEFTDRAGKSRYINLSIVNKDIRQIKSGSKIIEEFRHKFVAHHAYNQKLYKTKPTYKQAHDYIDKLAEIYKKYYQLITGRPIEIIDDWEIKTVKNDIAKIFNK